MEHCARMGYMLSRKQPFVVLGRSGEVKVSHNGFWQYFTLCKVSISEFFWSVFSSIWTKYRDLLCEIRSYFLQRFPALLFVVSCNSTLTPSGNQSQKRILDIAKDLQLNYFHKKTPS